MITYVSNQKILFQSKLFNELNTFNKLKTLKEEIHTHTHTHTHTRTENKCACSASELYNYNNFLEIYQDRYNKVSNSKKREFSDKYDPKELFLEGYDYSVRSENNEELTIKEELTDIPPMPPLKSDEEETKEGEG